MTAVTLGEGRRAAFLATLGIVCGLPVHATLSATGLAALLAASSTLYTTIKLVGGIYLCWLGLQAIRHARRETPDDDVRTRRGGNPFLRGFLSNVLNAKVALFYLTFLPQFISPTGSVFAQTMVLTAVHALEGFLWLVAYAYLIHRAASAVRSSLFRRGLETVSGVILIGLGLRAMTSTR